MSGEIAVDLVDRAARAEIAALVLAVVRDPAVPVALVAREVIVALALVVARVLAVPVVRAEIVVDPVVLAVRGAMIAARAQSVRRRPRWFRRR